MRAEFQSQRVLLLVLLLLRAEDLPNSLFV